MTLPNKITISRIVIAAIIIIVLMFPFDSFGISTIKLFINEAIVVDIKYFIAGVLYIIAFITDIIDGKIARKHNLITVQGKLLDLIADKFLVDSVLIILSVQGLINPLLTIVIIARDTVINSIKLIIEHQDNKVKLSRVTAYILAAGIVLTLFNNLPFELINIKVSDVLLIIAATVSVYSGLEYIKSVKLKQA